MVEKSNKKRDQDDDLKSQTRHIFIGDDTGLMKKVKLNATVEETVFKNPNFRHN